MKLGQLYKVMYLLCKKDEIKTAYFVGTCIDKKRQNYKLTSLLKKEKITLSFSLKNPLITKIINYNRYRKQIKLKKIS